MFDRRKGQEGCVSACQQGATNLVVIKGVLSGFSPEEESKFILFHQGNRIALVKGFALISIVLYLLFGFAAATILPGIDPGLWLPAYQCLLINWGVMLALIYLPQSRPYFYLSVAMCAHFSIAWTLLAAFHGQGWSTILLVLSANWMILLVYGSGALLFRYSVLSCFSVGVTVMVVARLFSIEMPQVWFVYLFLGAQAFGMLLGVCQEYWSRSYFLRDNQANEVRDKLMEEIETLQQMVNLDRATGLPSSVGFQKTLAQYWDDSQKSQRPLGVLIIQIKDYSILEQACTSMQIEDLVRACGHCLQNCASHTGDYFARFDQGAFSCLLPETDQHGVERVAAHMSDAIARAKIALASSDGQSQSVTVLISGVFATGQASEVKAIGFLKQATDRMAQLVSDGGSAIEIEPMNHTGSG